MEFKIKTNVPTLYSEARITLELTRVVDVGAKVGGGPEDPHVLR